MAHKSITLSETTYNVLEKLRGKKESINDVIVRLTKRLDLVEYVESTDFPEELADKIEEVYNERGKIYGREVKF
jgi:predicted CopG family antitoxin